jgi:hypothetical protein
MNEEPPDYVSRAPNSGIKNRLKGYGSRIRVAKLFKVKRKSF